jgi:hypothetical protein
LDIAEIIPEFKSLGKTTVRLHPRVGTAGPQSSNLGGHILWPSREPWPVCDTHETPFVPVLQLLKEDVPEIGFQEHTDCFQLLWCPYDHDPVEGPSPWAFWRDRSQIENPRVELAPRTDPDALYFPRPCLIHPERVVEYPLSSELTTEIRSKIEQSLAIKELLAIGQEKYRSAFGFPFSALTLYDAFLSVADGTKVGGYPGWVQDPWYPSCICGDTMEHLITFASFEFDGVTKVRWVPSEEQHAVAASSDQRKAVSSAPDWMFGDAGCLYVFICRACTDWPIRAHMQYS